MRANSAAFCTISSPNAPSTGAMSASSCCIGLSFIVDVYTPNSADTRANPRPACSSATIVFAKLGGSAHAVIAASSARYASMPARSASPSSPGWM